jgi:hypothetical protein
MGDVVEGGGRRIGNAGGTKGLKAPVEMSPNNSIPATFLDVINSDLLSHIRLQSAQDS